MADIFVSTPGYALKDAEAQRVLQPVRNVVPLVVQPNDEIQLELQATGEDMTSEHITRFQDQDVQRASPALANVARSTVAVASVERAEAYYAHRRAEATRCQPSTGAAPLVQTDGDADETFKVPNAYYEEILRPMLSNGMQTFYDDAQGLLEFDAAVADFMAAAAELMNELEAADKAAEIRIRSNISLAEEFATLGDPNREPIKAMGESDMLDE